LAVNNSAAAQLFALSRQAPSPLAAEANLSATTGISISTYYYEKTILRSSAFASILFASKSLFLKYGLAPALPRCIPVKKPAPEELPGSASNEAEPGVLKQRGLGEIDPGIE